MRRRGVQLSNGGMPRHIHLEPHLTANLLYDRYRHAADPVECSHWYFVWLLAGDMTATAVVAVTGYSAYWDELPLSGTLPIAEPLEGLRAMNGALTTVTETYSPPLA